MEAQGRIKGVSRDWKTGAFILTVECDSLEPDSVQALVSVGLLDISMEPHRERRSMNANAYFHVLVGKIAQALHTDNASVKNRLIRDYGCYEYVDGHIPTYLIKAEYEDQIIKKDGMHFNVIGYETHEGASYIRAAVMRGSHTYDTTEMSHLIDGTVEEAKALGIETLPPAELERMKSVWRKA